MTRQASSVGGGVFDGRSATEPPSCLSSSRFDSRINWLDTAKGIAIILVVFGHVLRGLASAGISPSHWAILDRLIYGFHMPFFFFLSGLMGARLERLSVVNFARSRLFALVWPYFLWSILQIGAEALAGSWVNSPVSIQDLSQILVQPYGQFWFLYALLLAQLAVWIMLGRTMLLGIVLLSLMILWPPTPIFAVAAMYTSFYLAGRLLAPGIGKWSARPWLLLAFPLYALLVSTSRSEAQPPAVIWYLEASLGIMAFTGASLYLGRGARLGDALAWIGTMSMSIYVMHIIAGSGARILMMRTGVAWTPWTFAWAGMFAGTALPILAHLVLRKCRLLPLFGLAKPAAAGLAGVADNPMTTQLEALRRSPS